VHGGARDCPAGIAGGVPQRHRSRKEDSDGVKQALRTAPTPLALVVSVGVGESVRSGRIGRADGLVSVEVAGRWHQGLIRTLGRAG
jgi:hypothetical protein